MNRSKASLSSPAMAVALTALVFAMTGVGYAATHLSGAPANAAKKKTKRGPAGPPGAAGQQGIQGVPGVNGATNVTMRTAPLSVPANSTNGATASCNPGEHATGGGLQLFNGAAVNTHVIEDMPDTTTAGSHPTGWSVTILSTNSSSAQDYIVFAVCAAP